MQQAELPLLTTGFLRECDLARVNMRSLRRAGVKALRKLRGPQGQRLVDKVVIEYIGTWCRPGGVSVSSDMTEYYDEVDGADTLRATSLM